MPEKFPDRPITLMISAIGGEGGGVLANWIVAAARHSELEVQATSIPGVAQRTGATVYYLEIYPVPQNQLKGKRPILGIYPGIGDIDIMISSEFAEVGRAIANGFITPDRTTLIASSHRVFAINEKSDPADGRMDDTLVINAVNQRAAKVIVDDLNGLAEKSGVSLNAVLLGVLADEVDFISRSSFEAAIQESGISTERNLQGFELGFSHKFRNLSEVFSEDPKNEKRYARRIEKVSKNLGCLSLPQSVQSVAMEGFHRLSAYQSKTYATLYIDRLVDLFRSEQACGGNGSITLETARHLAVRMSYEDIIRVAQLKIDPARIVRIRKEVRAGSGEPVEVYDYFKPGLEELGDILPRCIGRHLLFLARKWNLVDKTKLGIRFRSTTILGFMVLRILAGMRWLRPKSYGYSRRQENILQYLSDVKNACPISTDFAWEVAACGALEKGYGSTAKRTGGKIGDLRTAIIEPVFEGKMSAFKGCDALANARVVATKDADGNRLGELLRDIVAAS